MRTIVIVLIGLSIPMIANANPLSDIALSLFGLGGEASVLIKLMLVGVVGSLLVKLTGAAGEGQTAGLIKVAGIFIAIFLVTATAWKAIEAVARIAGLV